MAIKFQYNKTSLNNLGKQLKVRQRALPTLKNKESALRVSVIQAKAESERLQQELEEALKTYDYMAGLWTEFEPGLIAVKDVELTTVKVAGVRTPELKEVIYEVKPFNAFAKPMWYGEGVAILKKLAQLGIESEVYTEKSRILEAEGDQTVQQTQEMLDTLAEGPEFIETFDAELFQELVDQIIVEDGEHIAFQLKNGLKLRETAERIKR